MFALSDIIVAGAGHGGLVAAMKLAREGHNVTVYEKNTKKNCGLDQVDAFDEKAMTYAGIDIPFHFHAESNRLTFVPLDSDSPSLTMPVDAETRYLKVNRKEFLKYLIDLCSLSRVNFKFGTEILGPVMLGDRVVGIKTAKSTVYADLVIDACGVNSPLRKNLPSFTLVENNYSRYEVLHTYRACFNKIPGEAEPETNFNLLLRDDGTVGLSWFVNEPDRADILIARFNEPTEDEINPVLASIREKYPVIGENLISGGKITDIPVRQPLAVFVADGYAAVGDSAFMTYAAKGSGIAYSIMAGAMLAQTVIKDKDGFFNCETLWEYEKTFYKEIGFDACRIAVMKNLLPYVTAQEVSDLFKNGLLTTEEIAYFLDINFVGFVKTKIMPIIKSKLKVLNDFPEFKAKLLDLVGWIGKMAVTESSFPKKYDRDDVIKWAEKYNDFFDSIRKPE